MAQQDSKGPRVRFDAEIRLSGPNAYVEVPARVSERLTAYARAGRISVAGTIRGVEFRTTLVLRKAQRQACRHWLFVNGGMQSSAGVGVGDRVRIALSPVSHLGEAPPPTDLARALQQAEAMADYRRLEPAHRWQLIRFLDGSSGGKTTGKPYGCWVRGHFCVHRSSH